MAQIGYLYIFGQQVNMGNTLKMTDFLIFAILWTFLLLNFARFLIFAKISTYYVP